MSLRVLPVLLPSFVLVLVSSCGDDDGIDTAPSDDRPQVIESSSDPSAVAPTDSADRPASSEEPRPGSSAHDGSGPAPTDSPDPSGPGGSRPSDPGASGPSDPSDPGASGPSDPVPPDPSEPSDPVDSSDPVDPTVPSSEPAPEPGEAAMPCDEERRCADDLLCIRLGTTHDVGFCAPTCSALHTPCGFFGSGVHAECSIELGDGRLACGFICELNHGDHVHNYSCPSGDWGRLRCERTRRDFGHRFCAPSQN
ncbi:MAG: hypothetical protein EA398_04935 [Deltaproteobacteria bacterium]|nr:MAG: hypothetical protein EA398_04935 [Deltaproteobacteria bacterium]